MIDYRIVISDYRDAINLDLIEELKMLSENIKFAHPEMNVDSYYTPSDIVPY